MYKTLCKHSFSFFWDKCSRVQLLDRIIPAQLDFKETAGGGGIKMAVWEDVELASPHN